MTEIRFYHLTRSSLESVLPTMLLRSLERGQRSVVMAGSQERVEQLNALLWSFDERRFLPHGSASDGYPSLQPIWLTAEDENPNAAKVLFLTDGARSERVGEFDLCALVFDGNDATALEQARTDWRTCQEAGHVLTYWQQDESGRWVEKQL